VEKSKVAVGIVLVILVASLFYFAGIYTGTPAKIQGSGAFIEPKLKTNELNSYVITNLSI